VIAALDAAGYRVIAMDCRGHGQSGKPHDAGQYGLEMVQDVVRLLDHLHVDRTHLVGYSMGGEIALQFAVRYPARLKTVAVLGAGWVGENTGPIRTLMNDMADGFAKHDATALVRGVTANGQDGTSLSTAEITAASQALFARNDADALAACARAMTTLFEIPKDRLLAVRMPMLAMVGDHDLSNVDGVKQLKTVVRGLEVVELAGANHATSVRPSAAPLVAFLNAHRD
jgi:pimeloyl-ACP methyl ester carboxylesterase